MYHMISKDLAPCALVSLNDPANEGYELGLKHVTLPLAKVGS